MKSELRCTTPKPYGFPLVVDTGICFDLVKSECFHLHLFLVPF